jgi:hypothetical protein
MDILDVLVQKGVLAQDKVEAIKAEAADTGFTVEQILLQQGINPSDILSAKGEYFDIPTRQVNELEISDKVLEYVPEDSAKHYRFVPLGVANGVLEIGMVDPDDIEARDALNFISSKMQMPFKIFLITEEDFGKVVALYKGLTGEVSKALSELESELKVELNHPGSTRCRRSCQR